MKTLDYSFKSHTEFSDLENTYILEVKITQVADNAFELIVLGAKSVPVTHDLDFDVPLYGFLPAYEHKESVYAESLEALHEHVKEVAAKALKDMETLELDAPS